MKVLPRSDRVEREIGGLTFLNGEGVDTGPGGVLPGGMRISFLIIGLMALSACNAAVGVSGGVQVPSDAASTCAVHCSTIGLQLSAVAIMANNVGCVCQPRSTALESPTSKYTAATSAGMATIAMQEAEASSQSARLSQQRGN